MHYLRVHQFRCFDKCCALRISNVRMTVTELFQVFRQRTSADAVDLVSHLLEYTPSIRFTPVDACAHAFFDELRDPATRFPNGRELPPVLTFTQNGIESFANHLDISMCSVSHIELKRHGFFPGKCLDLA